jgi:hypothetical protein
LRGTGQSGATLPGPADFSGYPGGPEQWLDSMNLGGAIDAAVDRRHLGQVITVSANVEVPPHVDTECVNGSGGDPVAGGRAY